METWFIVLLSFSIAALLRPLLFRRSSGNNLPPGPSFLSSNLLLLTNPLAGLEPVLKKLKSIHGPIITLFIGARPSIFIGTHALAHQALIQKGAIFSDRPKTFLLQLNISSASYGPTWRLLRRNLASEILHPVRIKSYSPARKRVLQTLIGRLQNGPEEAVVDHFRYAMFSLLVFMCFGDKVDEHGVNEVSRIQRRFLLAVGSGRFLVLGLLPRAGKILFRNWWKELLELRRDQAQVLMPLIESRIEQLKVGAERTKAYVDTLVDLRLPEEQAIQTANANSGKLLTHHDMVSVCSEFLDGGTDTTSTSLQWIMANLVKNPRVQSKLYDEIASVVGPPPHYNKNRQQPPPPPDRVISEEETQRLPYLKAVVLEGLRRHPAGHFVLPHRVAKDVELQGYVVPKGASINFMVAEMGRDPKVWEDPMEFKPDSWLKMAAMVGLI